MHNRLNLSPLSARTARTRRASDGLPFDTDIHSVLRWLQPS